MNCQRFEEICPELIRNRLIDLAERSEAEQHLLKCSQCALRYNREERLARGLDSLRQADQSATASAVLEGRLLESFRQKVAGVPAIAEHPAARSRYSKGMAWAAIAACLLLAVVLTAALWPSTEVNSNLPLAGAPIEGDVESDPEKQKDEVEDNKAPDQKKLERRHKPRKPRRRVDPDGSRHIVAQDNSASPEQETVSRFIPLVPDSTLFNTEGAQWMRVEVSRSTLASFGFPVSFDASDKKIKADLMVGYDGVARAIRFVQ